jgi:hypothetical protein
MLEAAAVCRSDIVNDQGGGTIWFVRLPDGYLLDCGCSYQSEERAADLARRLNQTYAADDADLPTLDDVRGILK